MAAVRWPFLRLAVVLAHFMCVLLNVNCCGISTHIAIAHQAITSFSDSRGGTDYRKIILDNQDAFEAGNPYPDAMYTSLCYGGKFHSVAEDTHWAPFLNATVNYIRKKYPKPWDQATMKLVAFTLGFVSHQVADVTWHSLGIKQGFLRTMGDVNFFGSFPAAHSVGDPGGDMIATFEGDTTPISDSPFRWYVPSEDLANIYTEYYGKEVVTREVIEICSHIEYMGWLGEKTGGAELFSKYAKQSPFLMENLHDYFQGGIADMAAWSSLLWHDTIDMLEHGTSYCHVPESPLFIKCNGSRHSVQIPEQSKKLKNPGPSLPKELFHIVPSEQILAVKSERGFHLSPSAEFLAQQQMNQIGREGALKSSYETKTTDDVDIKSSVYTTKEPYSRLGRSLVSGNFSGDRYDLVIGAPGFGTLGKSQHGRVYIVHGTNNDGFPLKDLDLDTQADQIIDGREENGRFGFALAVVDLNKDGLDDLVISAPSTGANNLLYTGTVYVFSGISVKGLQLNPALIIHGKGQYYNLGVNLAAADLDSDGYNDLLIGSPYASEGGPQRGSVAAFLGSTSRKFGSEITVYNSDWLMAGEQDYSWFGYALSNAAVGRQKILVVSAPTFRKCAKKNCVYSSNDTQSTGKVYVYPLSATRSSPIVTVTGSDTFMKLGTSLSIGRPHPGESPLLAISASTLNIEGHVAEFVSVTFEQAGVIYLANLTTLLHHGGGYSIDNIDSSAIFEGDRSYARFGWQTNWFDVNLDGIDDLVFSAPFRTDDITEKLRGAEQGEVYVYYGGSEFPSGKATRGCEAVDPCPGETASLVLKSSEDKSRFGSKFHGTRIQGSPVANLIVSATRSSWGAFQSGAVHVYAVAK